MQALLERLYACHEAREWVGERTLAEAWAECERPDWMLWLHARSQSADGHAYATLTTEKWGASFWIAAVMFPEDAAATAARHARNAASLDCEQCEDIRAALCCPVFDNDND